MTIIEPTTNRPASTPNRRGPVLAVAAAVVALVVTAAILFVATDDGATPITVPPTAPTTPPTLDDTRAAVTDAEELIATFNAGDNDALLDLMSDDLVMTISFGRGQPNPNQVALQRDELEAWLAWKQGQGEIWDEPTCRPADDQQAGGAAVDCQWRSFDGLMQAAGGEPAPTGATIVVVDGTVVELHLGFGTPDFEALGRHFEDWMQVSHADTWPQLEDWAEDTPAGAFERGRLRADWGDEWATFLDTYGCEPTQFCTVSVERWVAEYDDQCLAIEETSDGPTRALVEHMRTVPPPTELAAARRRLMEIDAELVGLGPSPGDAGAVLDRRQERADLMSELGVDERCWSAPAGTEEQG